MGGASHNRACSMTQSLLRAGAAAVLSVLVSGAAQAQSTPACATVTPAEIAALFDTWNTTLGFGDPHRMAALYAADAVLLPTVSNTPRIDRAGIVDYFQHFLKSKPSGAINSRSIKLGCNNAMDAGTYTFTLQTAAGAPTRVRARYTYVYAFTDGRWQIQHHHSSAMPEMTD